MPRRFCHKYKSRSIFCWDGIWLLILHFYGNGSVKTTNPQVWLGYASSCASNNAPDTITARKALYLLLRAAWQQCMYRRPPCSFEGYSLLGNESPSPTPNFLTYSFNLLPHYEHPFIGRSSTGFHEKQNGGLPTDGCLPTDAN